MLTAPSVCWGSPYYCDGLWGEKGEWWSLLPHHLSTGSEQLRWRKGNYAVFITRSRAQAYLFSHYINTVLYTPDGVPDVSSLMAASPLLHCLLSLVLPFSTNWEIAAFLGRRSPTLDRELGLHVCLWDRLSDFWFVKQCLCMYRTSAPVRMPTLSLTKVCLRPAVTDCVTDVLLLH